MLRYQGKRADGTFVIGSSTEDTPVQLVEDLFDKGWRELVVNRDEEVIGAIECIKGRLVWWAEAS